MFGLVMQSGLQIFFPVHNVPNDFSVPLPPTPLHPPQVSWIGHRRQRHSRHVLNALGCYTQISPFPHSDLFIMFIFLMARSYPYLLVKCKNFLLLTCLIQWIVGSILCRRYSDARLSSLGITLPHNWIKFRFLTIWLSTIKRTEALFVFT